MSSDEVLVLYDRHMRCGCGCHWDWGWIGPAFDNENTGILPSDIDNLFVVERRNRFLFIETKPLGSELSRGQELLLEALSRLPHTTVVAIQGKGSTPMLWKHVARGIWDEEWRETNRDDFLEYAREWREEP
jgi:hypothetical protein